MAEIMGAGAYIAIPAFWAARKVLGPTFDQIGTDLRGRYSESRLANAQSMFSAMNRRIEESGHNTGTIPPRVVMKTLEEASWCDAEVMAEYFGGILASSLSDDAADDRGVTWTSLVSRLATREIQLHYLAYSSLRRRLVGSTTLQLGTNQGQLEAAIYLPETGIVNAMNLATPDYNFNSHIVQSMLGLYREGLVGDMYVFGSRQHINESLSVDVPEDGVVFTPSASGIILFNWAHGLGDTDVNSILDPKRSFAMEPEILQVESPASIAELRPGNSPAS